MALTFETPESSPPSPSPSPNPSPQMKTVLHYLDLIKVLDIGEIGKLFTDDFVQSTRPLSLNVPSRTKEDDLEFLRGLSGQLEGRHIQITIYDVVECPGKVWVHLFLHGELQGGKMFDVECVYQFTLVKHLNSYKITAIGDFVDSAAFVGLGKDVQVAWYRYGARVDGIKEIWGSQRQH